MNTKPSLLAVIAAVASSMAGMAATAVQAHVMLQERSAPAGSTYKAAFGVGHGCDGSPVHTVTVRLPPGFRGAKPTPKPGWALRITRAPLATPYLSHGKTISDDVVEVQWAATSKDAWLQDAWYDEFVLRGQLPSEPGPLWFKVTQTCERGEIAWSEVPHHGTDTRTLKSPAALLEVTPAGPPRAAPAKAAGEHEGHAQ